MNEINTDQLLSQIRALGASLQPSSAPPPSQPVATGFGELLKNTINSVNDTQQHAQHLKLGFQSGASDTNLVEVMIASQKADISFRTMTEVRNKLVSAYQEIMNMPV